MIAPAIRVDLSSRAISFVRGAPTIQLLRPNGSFILAGAGGGAGGLPLKHPTLANTKIIAVPEGFQIVVEGVTILTFTKGGMIAGA